MHKYLLLLVPALLFGNTEETITIIKPNAVTHKHVGEIIARYEKENFSIENMKMTKLTKSEAEEFYKEHKGRPFYDELTEFMSSGPVVVMELKGDDAVFRNRQLIGDTNPDNAAPGTLRALYGQSKARNSVHGSDSAEAASREIAFFFN